MTASTTYRRKGDRSNWCEAPTGPFRPIGPVPFSHNFSIQTRGLNLWYGEFHALKNVAVASSRASSPR